MDEERWCHLVAEKGVRCGVDVTFRALMSVFNTPVREVLIAYFLVDNAGLAVDFKVPYILTF